MTAAADKAFVDCVDRPDSAVDLGRAALLIARTEYPELDVEQYMEQLDVLADAARGRLEDAATPAAQLTALNRYLFDECGFSGNATDYYDPRNSFLNDVMDRRLGIPISLSLIYLEVAWRLGLNLEGVSFPGHFLVKLPVSRGALVLDPYSGGAFLDKDDLLERLRLVMGKSGSINPSMLPRLLARAGKKTILVRMLRNLKAIFLHSKEMLRALSVSNQIVAISPVDGYDVRDRGAVLEGLECPAAAVADYQRYLKLVPGADDGAEIRERMLTLQQQIPTLN